MRWKSATQWRPTPWRTGSIQCWCRTSSRPRGSSPTAADRVDFKRHILRAAATCIGRLHFRTFNCGWMDTGRRARSNSEVRKREFRAGSRTAAPDHECEAEWRRSFALKRASKVYFRSQRTPSLVISTSRSEEVSSARMASETEKCGPCGQLPSLTSFFQYRHRKARRCRRLSPIPG